MMISPRQKGSAIDEAGRGHTEDTTAIARLLPSWSSCTMLMMALIAVAILGVHVPVHRYPADWLPTA
jgi:hypothetical protein